MAALSLDDLLAEIYSTIGDAELASQKHASRDAIRRGRRAEQKDARGVRERLAGFLRDVHRDVMVPLRDQVVRPWADQLAKDVRINDRETTILDDAWWLNRNHPAFDEAETAAVIGSYLMPGGMVANAANTIAENRATPIDVALLLPAGRAGRLGRNMGRRIDARNRNALLGGAATAARPRP